MQKGYFCLWACMDLLNRFNMFIRKQNLLEAGDRVLVAVSGGIDSVVLLDLCLKVQPWWDLTLAVAHMNHGLRGRLADRDEAFVRNLIRIHGLPFYSIKVDAKEYSKILRLSPEEGARQVRFRFLESLLNRLEFNRLALGHQANDQAETILMNLLRGSGLRGLGGIRPKRDRIIHPLLFASRKEIESHAEDQRLVFVDDASNRDKSFLRNQIRWDVVGKLEKLIGSRVVSSICRAGKAASEAEAFLESTAKKARWQITVSETTSEIVLDISEFLHYTKAVQKTLLIQILEESFPQKRIRSSEILRILCLAEEGRSGGIVELANDVRVVRSRDTLAFVIKHVSIQNRSVQVGQPIHLNEIGLQFQSTLLKKEENLVFTTHPTVEYLDFDTLPVPLSLRSCHPGDWFIPLGMEGKKKLQDFFVDEGIPVYRRSSVPLLVGGESILWVVRYRIDNRFKVTEETDRILKVEAFSLNDEKK